MQIEFVLNPDESVKSDILAGLRSYNVQFFPHDDSQTVACVVKDQQGHFVGGLFGEVYTNTLFVEYFWIDENQRKSGLGRQVFERVESEVKKLGVATICLDTFTFQAREFYLKMGFKEVGRFTGFPMPGVDKIFLQKHVG
nr:GNAT family N-acetyltransferase [Vibrio rhodolitus]